MKIGYRNLRGHWGLLALSAGVFTLAALPGQATTLPDPLVGESPVLEAELPVAVSEQSSLLPNTSLLPNNRLAENPAPLVPTRSQPSVDQLLEGTVTNQPMGQVTAVSQLSDVQPTDWAYQAVQSLVERYGCIAGYPNATFRGNRAATRYELAAALNACLDVISDRFATKEDLLAVRRLQEEFAKELAALKGRVNQLEARTAKLESQQFSTTTKLSGEAVVSLIAAGGGAPGSQQPNPIVAYRTRLNLVTSFTGRDTLITGLQAFNFGGGLLGNGSVQNTLFPGSALNSGSSGVSFAPQFAGVDPTNLGSTAFNANNIHLYKLLYVFPVAKNFTAFAFPKAEATDAFPQIIPWSSDSQGALSRFAGVNPVVRLTTGTSGVGLPSGFGFIWNPNKVVNLTGLYGSGGAANPTLGGGTPGNTPLGSGFFPNDETSFIGALQATFKPTRKLDAAFNFAYAQHALNVLGTGLASGGLLGTGGDIFSVPGSPNGLDQRVQLVGLGGTVTYRVTPRIALSAYAAGIFVDAIGGTNTLGLTQAVGSALRDFNGGAVYTSFMGGVQFSDVFLPGSTAAIIFGQPLHLESLTGNAALPPGFNQARPFHLEAYYRFKVNDNISVTPGAFVIFNPESNADNRTTAVGMIRTTFTF